MWIVIAIMLLAIPLSFALENIRKEIEAMRAKKNKVDDQPEKQDKFDNWYLGNDKLIQEAENKKTIKEQKRQKKSKQFKIKNDTQKDNQNEFEI